MLLVTDFVAHVLAYFSPSAECEMYATENWLQPPPTRRILRFCYDQLINESNELFVVKNKVYMLELAPKITLKYYKAYIWLCKCDKPFEQLEIS